MGEVTAVSAVSADVRPAPAPRQVEDSSGAPQPDRVSLLAHVRRPHIRDVGIFGVFVAIFAMALRPVVDNDVFWHLATGRYMWTAGHIPHADPFSWTAPGRAWIAHEWLTEALLYPLYTHGGYPALMLVFAAVITAAFALSYATARLLGATRPIGVVVVGVAAIASTHTWGVRPQMLSLLLTALTVWILTRARTAGLPRLLWALPPLLTLWVNLHGGFIFGLVIIGVAALARTCEGVFTPSSLLPRVGEKSLSLAPPAHGDWPLGPTRGPTVQRASGGAWGDASPQTPAIHSSRVAWGLDMGDGLRFPLSTPRGAPRARDLWRVFALSFVACLLNPNGLRGLIYPFTYLGDNASMRYIAEWVSPDFHQGQYQFFEALLLALVAGVALSPRRPRLAEVLLVLLFTHLALVSVRNINLFSIVVAPFIAVYLSYAWRDLWRHVRSGVGSRKSGVGSRESRGRVAVQPAVAALNLALAAVLVVAVLVSSAPNLTAKHNMAIQAGRFPAGTVSYLRTHQLTGPLFNSYDWGGYLIWTLYPRVRVYVDGRPDMYGDHFIDDFVHTWQARPGWQATLRRQGVRLVLVEPSSGLGRALAGAPGWRVVSRDKVSVLYARTS